MGTREDDDAAAAAATATNGGGVYTGDAWLCGSKSQRRAEVAMAIVHTGGLRIRSNLSDAVTPEDCLYIGYVSMYVCMYVCMSTSILLHFSSDIYMVCV